MNRVASCHGMTLVELLVAMTIASIAGIMILQLILNFQSRILAEISRNDLQDRAERLIRFVASDIRDAAFLLGPVPQTAEGVPLILTHDSLAGDPIETLPFSLVAEDLADGDDRLTLVKAVSFIPPLRLAQTAQVGGTSVVLNRRPNRSPGSTRELQPAPEAINHLVFASQHTCYPLRQANLEVELEQPLRETVSADTEVLGLRACIYEAESFAGSKRLRRDDFTSREILDQAVDGLQFEYLLDDGAMVDQPADTKNVRGIRISLLVRSLRQDRDHIDTGIYSLANQVYGPFHDHFRRQLVTRLVEVKNHGL
jgi:prepilin-type N-terminal cleavage/methylation domain-containing protein